MAMGVGVTAFRRRDASHPLHPFAGRCTRMRPSGRSIRHGFAVAVGEVALPARVDLVPPAGVGGWRCGTARERENAMPERTSSWVCSTTNRVLALPEGEFD